MVFGKPAGFAANLDLSTLDGSNGFQINGEAADDSSGRSVASAGDVNGDGFDDLIVGAAYADDNGTTSGASYVVFGHATPPSAPADGNGTVDRATEGAAAGTTVGITVTSTATLGRSVTYTLSNSANGAFQINAATGVVSVADGTKIDHESAPGHAYGIVVQATDSAGEQSSASFTVNLTDVNDNAAVITTATRNPSRRTPPSWRR